MSDDIAKVLARIEQRQAAYEVVAHRILGMLEVHNEKLDAILQAATVEPGPSPVAEILVQILDTMRRQTELLEGLPDAISETIRDEMQREFVEDEAEWELAQESSEEDGPEQGPEGAAEDQP